MNHGGQFNPEVPDWVILWVFKIFFLLFCIFFSFLILLPIRQSLFGGPSVKEGRKEENVLFNDALNTFYLRLYGVRFFK